MINKERREVIAAVSPEAILFENPSFDHSIIGLTSAGAVVYDLEKMIDELANDDSISADEAYEFIDYNTLRSLGYATLEGIAPIVIDRSLFED